jgi:WD40 repeat protein
MLAGMRIVTACIILVFSASLADAVDISPSRTVVPENIRNAPGKRYSIFAGDPERVQKANEVNTKEFRAAVSLDPTSISLSEENGEITATFTIHNSGAKSYTLSFPDAQRYDLALVTMDDQLLYLWSSDKMFVQEIGMSFLNGDERLTFNQTLSLDLIKQHCQPGKYKVAMILSNYPELKAAAELVVRR